MIRVAAFGDVHVGEDSRGRLAPFVEDVADHADLLVVAGDLTRCGTAAETAVLADDLRDLGLPVVAVLGNHDHHADEVAGVVATMERAGVQVLEGSAAHFTLAGCSVGVAGAKGFGGGFPGASGSAFGEPEMKVFMHHARRSADVLGEALAGLDAQVRIALTHYAPIPETLQGERLEIYPFLGSGYLAEAIDGAAVDLALHGHAHHGTERGMTPGGIPVRNVAQPVLRRAYRVYTLGPSDQDGLPLKGDGASLAGNESSASRSTAV